MAEEARDCGWRWQTRLAVGEDSAVETFQDGVDDAGRGLVVQILRNSPTHIRLAPPEASGRGTRDSTSWIVVSS